MYRYYLCFLLSFSLTQEVYSAALRKSLLRDKESTSEEVVLIIEPQSYKKVQGLVSGYMRRQYKGDVPSALTQVITKYVYEGPEPIQVENMRLSKCGVYVMIACCILTAIGISVIECIWGPSLSPSPIPID